MMFATVIKFARRQNPEEIARQYNVLNQVVLKRLALTIIVYSLALVFLPLWLATVLAIVDATAETAGLHLMRNLKPERQPFAYLGSVASVITTEAAYMTLVALLWQMDNAYAKALATGLASQTLLQLAVLRSIHLPYAAAGLATAVIAAMVAILGEWQQLGGMGSLALQISAMLASAWFVLMTLQSNHHLHDQMARDRSAAQAADRAKSRFLAQISHELRTPMNAILGLGHAELAAETRPEHKERLDLIVGSARNLSVLLDDILDMSAIEEGRMTLRPRTTNPAIEITSAVALYRQFFTSAGLDLIVRIDPSLPRSAALDAQRLRQCLTNLLSNALKNTRHGGVTVTAAMMAPSLLAIEVSDTGIGISPDEAEGIFEPFRQGSAATSGTGLGLSISRSLARAMGGDLRLVERPPGACFRLTLMLSPVSDLPVPMPPRPLPSARFTGARVLIVDDIATNRLVARVQLSIYGLLCEEAPDGETALARIVADPPDIVLLDLAMPGMDGNETLRRLRAMPPPISRLRVVAMTADATLTNTPQRGPLGFDGYLVKPLTPEAVGQLLSDQLGERVLPQMLP
jgi:signal transduction histidine kinase/CheY-like chemotaxis protein